MAIKKAPVTPSSVAIDKVINAGSPPVPQPDLEEPKVIKFVMEIPSDYIEPIERVRKKIKASRRSWFLTAAIEKLQRDGEL